MGLLGRAEPPAEASIRLFVAGQSPLARLGLSPLPSFCACCFEIHMTHYGLSGARVSLMRVAHQVLRTRSRLLNVCDLAPVMYGTLEKPHVLVCAKYRAH